MYETIARNVLFLDEAQCTRHNFHIPSDGDVMTYIIYVCVPYEQISLERDGKNNGFLTNNSTMRYIILYINAYIDIIVIIICLGNHCWKT